MKALGMVEVYGYLTAIEALDSALKAANVNLVDVTMVRGGLVTVLISGDVGAVKAAVDASKTAASKVGKIISVHVIPRPSKEVEKIIPFRSPDKEEVEPNKIQRIEVMPELNKVELIEVMPELNMVELIEGMPESNKVEQIEPLPEHNKTQRVEDMPESQSVTSEENLNHPQPEGLDKSQITVEALKSMTVDRLRKLARDVGITNMTRKEIRFATKHELIDSISKFIEEER